MYEQKYFVVEMNVVTSVLIGEILILVYITKHIYAFNVDSDFSKRGMW